MYACTCIKFLWDTITLCNTYKIHSPVSFHQQRKLHSRSQYDNTAVCCMNVTWTVSSPVTTMPGHQLETQNFIMQYCMLADVTQRHNYTLGLSDYLNSTHYRDSTIVTIPQAYYICF